MFCQTHSHACRVHLLLLSISISIISPLITSVWSICLCVSFQQQHNTMLTIPISLLSLDCMQQYWNFLPHFVSTLIIEIVNSYDRTHLLEPPHKKNQVDLIYTDRYLIKHMSRFDFTKMNSAHMQQYHIINYFQNPFYKREKCFSFRCRSYPINLNFK